MRLGGRETGLYTASLTGMRALIILVALPWIFFTQARERVRFRLRERLGNVALRPSCCDPLPGEYEVGLDLVRIDALKEKAKLVATINTGYTLRYCCRICGQEWVQRHAGRGQGEYAHVFKAS